MTWGVLALVSLGAYRLARVVTTDDLGQPVRDWVLRRWPSWSQPMTNPANGAAIADTAETVPSWQTKLVNCGWCLTVWTCALLVVADHFAGYLDSWQLAALAWPATAAAAGLLVRIGG